MTTTAGDRLPYLLSKLKAPRVRERLQITAERARAEGWAYEQFLEVLLEAEVFARDASGARHRIRHAAFPAHKTLEDFDFTAQPSAEKPLLLHLAQLTWIVEHANVCLIGPPGTGKTHLAIALSIKACQAGHRVAFATAQQWVTRLEAAQDRNNLDDELRRLERYGLLVVDEVGYLPLERQAANLLFALVLRCYERGSIIITSNRVFEAWGAKSSATRWSPPRSSIGSSTTRPWSRSRARATGSANAAPTSRLPEPSRRGRLPDKHSQRRRFFRHAGFAGSHPCLDKRKIKRQRLAHFSLPESGALFGSR